MPENASFWPHRGIGDNFYEAPLTTTTRWKTPLALGAVLSVFALAGCSETTHGMSAAGLADAVTPSFVKSNGYSARDKECLSRAMFFESKRSSRAGMIAVGTVVMNRKRSGQYPDTICGVVGQKQQFAPGVMTRPMNSKAMPDVMEAAEAVLKGERDPKLKNAMHFHTAGLKFPYKNMHYVTVAGGNAFYEKRGRRWQPLPPEQSISAPVMLASAVIKPVVDAVTSEAEPVEPALPAEVAVAAAPAPEPKAKPVAVATVQPTKPVLVASAFPPPPKLGTPAPRPETSSPTLPESAPVVAVSDMAQPDQPVFSFEASPEDADAIGQLLLTQSRPE